MKSLSKSQYALVLTLLGAALAGPGLAQTPAPSPAPATPPGQFTPIPSEPEVKSAVPALEGPAGAPDVGNFARSKRSGGFSYSGTSPAALPGGSFGAGLGGGPTPGFGGGGFGGGRVGGSARALRESIPPLIVEFTNTDPAAYEQMDEDLAIMGRVLSEALERGLGEETPPSKMGVPLLFTFSGRSVRPIYLSGFGALFMIKVNMPLLAPPAPKAEPAAEKAPSTEWESARKEVLGLDAREDMVGEVVDGSDESYDPEQVEALKRTLIGALKNAANIRGLKADDAVSIAVFGQAVAEPVSFKFTPSGTAVDVSTSTKVDSDISTGVDAAPGLNQAPGKTTSRTVVKNQNKNVRKSNSNHSASGGGVHSRIATPAFGTFSSRLSPKGSVLTLQARKSDIDAFSEGKSNLDDFTKKVSIHAYAGNGYGITSVNSWVRSNRQNF